MFRVGYQHLGQLIQVADYKANMIISICTMLISAIIAILGYGLITGKGESYVPILIAPIIIIVFSCLISLICAIRAARPKFVGMGKKGDDRKSGILYFGVIAQNSQEAYLSKMKEVLRDDETIVEQMTYDIYNQGIVLKHKYNLLRDAYFILLIGFITSVTLFLISLVWV